jgi:hypothetical protein
VPVISYPKPFGGVRRNCQPLPAVGGGAVAFQCFVVTVEAGFIQARRGRHPPIPQNDDTGVPAAVGHGPQDGPLLGHRVKSHGVRAAGEALSSSVVVGQRAAGRHHPPVAQRGLPAAKQIQHVALRVARRRGMEELRVLAGVNTTGCGGYAVRRTDRGIPRHARPVLQCGVPKSCSRIAQCCCPNRRRRAPFPLATAPRARPKPRNRTSAASTCPSWRQPNLSEPQTAAAGTLGSL